MLRRCGQVVVIKHRHQAKAAERRCKFRIDSQRFVNRLARQGVAFVNGPQAKVRLVWVHSTQLYPGRCVAGVYGQCLLQQRKGLLKRPSRIPVIQMTALQIQRIGFRVGLPHHGHIAQQCNLQMCHHCCCDLVLDGEDIVQRAVESLGPQVDITIHLNQLCGNPHLVTSLAHAAFQHITDV